MGTQLKCIVRKRFVDDSGIRERFERYISKAVIDGTINYTPISFDAIHSVCALPEPSKYTDLFNLLYTLNEETRGCIKQEWGKIRWNNYYPRCRRCFCLDCATATQFHLFTNWNRYSGKIDVSYVIRRSNSTTTIYVGVHTVCLTL